MSIKCKPLKILQYLLVWIFSLPYKIGSNITIKKYNKFLERQESSGYKYQRRDNGDVFIIDMNDSEHGFVASLLHRRFNVPNANFDYDPPILVGIDECK